MRAMNKIGRLLIIAAIAALGIGIPMMLTAPPVPTNLAPRIVSGYPMNDPSINETESQLFNVTAQDPEGGPLSYAWMVDSVKVGLDADSYTFTTDYSSAGSYLVKVRISDGTLTGERSWTMTVLNRNRDPIMTENKPSSDPTINEGESQEFNVTVADPDGDTLAYAWSMDDTPAGTNSRSFTVDTSIGDAGTYAVEVNASDGAGSVTHAWTLSVLAANSAPVLSDPSPSADPTIDETDSIEFSIAAVDPDLDPLTCNWTVNGTAVGGNATAYLHVTHHGDEGRYEIIINVTDGSTCSTLEWTLTVKGLVQLVKEFQAGAADGDPVPSANALLGGYLYMRASGEGIGSELYRSDGTTGGTTLVKDINPGTGSSNPSYFVLNASNSILYFCANDGTHGVELWRTDGSAGGTSLVKDIYPGTTDGIQGSTLLLLNGLLLFAADDGVNGTEVWGSDGTEEGTRIVKDINPSGYASPYHLTVMNDQIYFCAIDGVHGRELWTSNGTADGTYMVKDINVGSGEGVPYNWNKFVVNDSVIYFQADDGNPAIRSELWKTNGTADGTVLVKDVNPGGNDGEFRSMLMAGNQLFFGANHGSLGWELWVSNGTTDGTHMVKDIYPGFSSGFYYYNSIELVAYGDIVVFTAYNTSTNGELWRSDGTESGTYMIKDINLGGSGSANHFFVAGDRVIFDANNGTTGQELWITDGTEAGTFLLKDINPGASFSNCWYFGRVGDYVLFQADHVDYGIELWSYKIK